MESPLLPLLLLCALVAGLVVGVVAAFVFARRSERAVLAEAGADARARLAAAAERIAARDAEVRDLESRLASAEATARVAQEALGVERVARTAAEIELREERESSAEKLRLLADAREELTRQFKALAGEALEASRQRLATEQEGGLGRLLSPLNEKLATFERAVRTTYDNEAQQRAALRQEVLNLREATARINEDAVNLTRALKGEAKTRGNWGEVVLERVLERSGLVRGVEYEIQQTLRDDEGAMHRPDVVVRLPGDKHVVIDSKVSLVDYERYYAAGDDASRDRAARQHVQSLRRHIEALSKKGYQDRAEIDPPDFVALFLPIEPALGLASTVDHELFVDAWDAKVVLVTPGTLLAMLATVRSLWQREKQTRHAIEIAQESGKLYDHFVLLVNSLDGVGRNLAKATEAYDDVRKKLQTGKGNVVRRVERLREMGAKATRELPRGLVERATEDDDEDGPATQASLTLVVPAARDGEGA